MQPLKDTQRDRLKVIAEDDLALTSLRALASIIIENAKPRDLNISDTEVGQRYRGYMYAKDLIEQVLYEIEMLKDIEDSDSSPNPAL